MLVMFIRVKLQRMDIKQTVRFYGSAKKNSSIEGRKIFQDVIKSKNIHFLGYVSDEDYLYHISSVDFVIVLTDMKYTLNCGSYEALSFEKPMLLGDTETIRGYFRKGAVYTDLDKESIIQSVDFLAANLKKLEGDAKLLKVELRSSWQQLFEKAEKQIEGL